MFHPARGIWDPMCMCRPASSRCGCAATARAAVSASPAASERLNWSSCAVWIVGARLSPVVTRRNTLRTPFSARSPRGRRSRSASPPRSGPRRLPRPPRSRRATYCCRAGRCRPGPSRRPVRRQPAGGHIEAHAGGCGAPDHRRAGDRLGGVVDVRAREGRTPPRRPSPRPAYARPGPPGRRRTAARRTGRQGQ